MSEKLYIMACPASYHNQNYHVKIGVSRNPQKRLSNCRSVYDPLLSLRVVYGVGNPRAIEKLVKWEFRKKRAKNIWTEFFEVEHWHMVKNFVEIDCGVGAT